MMNNETTEAKPEVKQPTTKEFVEMAERCRDEIKMLRNHIANLEPKARAYDDISQLLSMLPRVSQGAGEDLVWALDRRIKALKSE